MSVQVSDGKTGRSHHGPTNGTDASAAAAAVLNTVIAIVNRLSARPFTLRVSLSALRSPDMHITIVWDILN